MDAIIAGDITSHITSDSDSKVLPPYYIWICLSFTIFILGGILGGIYVSICSSRRVRRKYSWCLLCDKKRTISISEIRQETYNSFLDVTPAEQIVLSIFHKRNAQKNNSNEDDTRDWLPLPGGIKSIESCPNIYGTSFESHNLHIPHPIHSKPKRSASASIVPVRDTLMIINEDTEEDEEDREDLFL
mmetsp:Transcript_9859/g.13640  ORF Transcript_9859/g.13640 Transcript_9859/m.13640 type:complete len:187 (-) Transcript_9859:297-857(-)|eukprot:jgi/Bigna1/128821/aug1.7_g3529